MRYAVIAVTEGQAHSNALQAIFDETEELELVDLVEGSADILHAVSRRECHAVLVDSAISWASPYEIVREIQGRLPHIAVLVVEQASSPGALEAAVDAGARGVINITESFDEVRRKVLSAAQWSLKVRGLRSDVELVNEGVSTIVAVVGSKGGVGTTSIALHLARHSQSQVRRVCLVDLDLSKGDVSLYANIEPRRDISDLVQLGEGLSIQAIEDVVFIDKDGGHFLAAPKHPERGEEIVGESIRSLLITLRQTYELIILDCGSAPSDILGSALEVADEVLVVVTQDLASMKGAMRLVDMCERLSIRNSGELRILINRANRRADIQSSTIQRMLPSPMVGAEIGEHFREFELATNSRNPGLVTSKEFHREMSKVVGALAPRPEKGETIDTDEDPRERSGKRLFGRRSEKSEVGAITVEFMLLFPFIMLIFALCLQTIVYAAARVQASQGANAAASSAARGDDYRRAGLSEVNDRFKSGFTVSQPSRGDGYVSVKASVRVPSVIPQKFMGDGRVVVKGTAVEEG